MQVNQDQKELSEIARSIASLFGAEEELEMAADAVSVEEERHPDVAVSLGLEDALDAPAEVGPPPVPTLTAEPEIGDSVVAPMETVSTDVEASPAAPESEVGTPESELATPVPELDVPTPELAAPTPDLAAPESDMGAPEMEASTPMSVPSGPGQVPSVAEPGQMPPSQPPALSVTGQALSEATSHYLQAPTHEREGAQSALRTAVEASRAAGGLDEIAGSVNLLLLQGAGQADVEEMAGELMGQGVLAGMVARLGTVRDVEEREGLIKAYLNLGAPVAEAIADALTDTDDRLARKTYVEALGAFGDTGARAAEKMLQDSRWFVARNGVAVITVVGGPNAIEPLTACLAHEHPGVRQESVRSLAKIGGENAGLLVSGMLGDSDPNVRAAAVRAISALKVERAFRQLIEMLTEGDEEEVMEEVLRALGSLGDPSAVSAIEKRIKGSLLRRPSKAIRLAGIAALAAIGTPKAMSLVSKAATQKDPEVSALAQQLLRK